MLTVREECVLMVKAGMCVLTAADRAEAALREKVQGSHLAKLSYQFCMSGCWLS